MFSLIPKHQFAVTSLLSDARAFLDTQFSLVQSWVPSSKNWLRNAHLKIAFSQHREQSKTNWDCTATSCPQIECQCNRERSHTWISQIRQFNPACQNALECCNWTSCGMPFESTWFVVWERLKKWFFSSFYPVVQIFEWVWKASALEWIVVWVISMGLYQKIYQQANQMQFFSC